MIANATGRLTIRLVYAPTIAETTIELYKKAF